MIIEQKNPYLFLIQIKKFLEQKQGQILSKFIDNTHIRQSINIEQELQGCLINNAIKENLLQKLYYASKQLIKKVEEKCYHYQKQINFLNEELLKSNYIYKKQTDNLKEFIRLQQHKLKIAEGQIIQVNEQNDKSKQFKQQREHEFQLVLQEKENLKQSYNILEEQNKKLRQQILNLTLLHDQLLQKIQVQKNINQQLKSKNQMLLKEIKSLQQNLFILQIDIRNYKEQIDQLKIENQTMSSKFELINQPKSNKLLEDQYDQNKPLNRSPRYQSKDISNRTSQSKIISSKLQKTSNKKMLKQLIRINTENSNKARKIQQKWNYAYFDKRSKQVSEFGDVQQAFDPYYCFFLLLVQCAKLNSKNFMKVSGINISDYWQKLISQCVPMNKWYDRIVRELQNRVS